MGGSVSRTRAADDFATIRARLDELRREREQVTAPDDPSAAARQIRSESDLERRRRARLEGSPPPWVPTIFVKKPRI